MRQTRHMAGTRGCKKHCSSWRISKRIPLPTPINCVSYVINYCSLLHHCTYANPYTRYLTMKVIIFPLLTLGLSAVTVAHAETYNWNGPATGATRFLWGTETNWSPVGVPDSETADVRVETASGLVEDYGLRLNVDATVNSVYFNLSRIALISANSKTLRIADGGGITFGSALTDTRSAFGSTNTSHRVRLAAIGDMSLRNEGTGTVTLGYGYFYNDASSTADSTFTVSGAGNWSVGNTSYVGRQKASLSLTDAPTEDVQYGVSLNLANDFSGTFTYGGTITADLKNLEVNGGTLIINSARAMSASDGALVGASGTLVGAGTLNGNLVMAGKLFTATSGAGATFTVDGDLTLTETATTTLRLLPTSVDSISGTGILTLDGALVTTGTPPGEEISDVLLYTGFSDVLGDWSSVSLFGTDLSSFGEGLWRGVIGDYLYEFNSQTGMLGTAIPEPSAIALILGSAVAGIAVMRRRRRAL